MACVQIIFINFYVVFFIYHTSWTLFCCCDTFVPLHGLIKISSIQISDTRLHNTQMYQYTNQKKRKSTQCVALLLHMFYIIHMILLDLNGWSSDLQPFDMLASGGGSTLWLVMPPCWWQLCYEAFCFLAVHLSILSMWRRRLCTSGTEVHMHWGMKGLALGGKRSRPLRLCKNVFGWCCAKVISRIR